MKSKLRSDDFITREMCSRKRAWAGSRSRSNVNFLLQKSWTWKPNVRHTKCIRVRTKVDRLISTSERKKGSPAVARKVTQKNHTKKFPHTSTWHRFVVAQRILLEIPFVWAAQTKTKSSWNETESFSRFQRFSRSYIAEFMINNKRGMSERASESAADWVEFRVRQRSCGPADRFGFHEWVKLCVKRGLEFAMKRRSTTLRPQCISSANLSRRLSRLHRTY
jgi:hypothetical protein